MRCARCASGWGRGSPQSSSGSERRKGAENGVRIGAQILLYAFHALGLSAAGLSGSHPGTLMWGGFSNGYYDPAKGRARLKAAQRSRHLVDEYRVQRILEGERRRRKDQHCQPDDQQRARLCARDVFQLPGQRFDDERDVVVHRAVGVADLGNHSAADLARVRSILAREIEDLLELIERLLGVVGDNLEVLRRDLAQVLPGQLME